VAPDVLVQTRIDKKLFRWLEKTALAEGESIASLLRKLLLAKRAEDEPETIFLECVIHGTLAKAAIRADRIEALVEDGNDKCLVYLAGGGSFGIEESREACETRLRARRAR
jgi:hypothetical protein